MAEKEYIEREAVIELLTNRDVVINPNDEVANIREDVECLPAADVRPVVKAKWVYTDMSRLVCSNCGNPVAFALKEDGWHHGDYCSNCGADMREES